MHTLDLCMRICLFYDWMNAFLMIIFGSSLILSVLERRVNPSQPLW